MTNIKCPLEECAYRGKHGTCHRKNVALELSDKEYYTFHCLGWATSETRLFTEAMNGEIDKEDDRHVN